MNTADQQRTEFLYQQHLTALSLQGKRPATIDGYSRALRRIIHYFDRCPDTLELQDLQTYFAALILSHSWSTVKIDRNALQFFYKHVLKRHWQWLNIVKPPLVKTLPDILTQDEVARLISTTRQLRYQVCFLTLYTLGLRLGEGLALTIHDIDAPLSRVHIRLAKGGKDRYVPLPARTLKVLRHYWQSHRHPLYLFPGKPDSTMDRGGVQKALKKTVSDCRISKKISPHNLRHSYATHLLEMGVDLLSIQQLLGHQSPTTTARYARLTQQRATNTQGVINQLADWLELDWESHL